MKRDVLESLDVAISLICEELRGRDTKTVIALAGVIRDLVVARAILSAD